MVNIVYTRLNELTDIQTNIMLFVDYWVHTYKIPVPLKEIIIEMTRQAIKKPTIIKALNSLVKKGYIRRSSVRSNTTEFVQLRRV